jgi:hypothetical protein
MTQSVVEVLTKARALIEKPENWTQRTYAKTRWLRAHVSPGHWRAYAFCSLGAIRRVAADGDAENGAWRAMHAALGEGPVYFNDAPGRTHAEILWGFDRAIEQAKATGA